MDGDGGSALRVVIADDHPFYREGLAGLLRECGIDVVASVPNAEAALRAARQHQPDVVVMDLNMPGVSGIEATARITGDAALTCQVLMLTVSAQESDVTEAIVAGARGYVLKESPVEDVVAGIEAAAAGQSFVSPRVATLVFQRLQDAERAGAAEAVTPLSPREREVLALVAEGRSNQEIAAELLISTSTVRHHISSILVKLQVQNRIQAAVHAVRSRIV